MPPDTILLGEARALGLHRVAAILDGEAFGLVSYAQTLAETALRLRRGAKPGEALHPTVTPAESAQADRFSVDATALLIRAEQMLAQKAQP